MSVPHTHFTETSSTMVAALKVAETETSPLFFVTADAQTAGQGRRGRLWHTFSGHSLALTFGVREGGEHLALVAALAVQQAILKFTPTATIKWPNDVLIDGKKVAGILVEKHADLYLVGMGLNVTTPPTLPEGFEGITLQQAGGICTVEDVQQEVVRVFVQWLQVYQQQGWAYLTEDYRANCSTLGQQVTWREGSVTGKAEALTDEGALLIEDKDGKTHTVHAGEIIQENA